MDYLRFKCYGRVNKPLPSALVSALPVIKSNLIDLQSYAQKINVNKPNEEATNLVAWGDETDYVWFRLDLAIPMPLPEALQVKLPIIRSKIQQLKAYAVNTGRAAFYGKYHICHHGTNQLCGPVQEI